MRRGRLLTLLLVGALAACRDTRVVTNTYQTLDEARAAGAISAGFVPEGLPAGVHDMREAHDPKTGQHWGIFSFPGDRRGALTALLNGEETSLAGMQADVPGRIEWWPPLLRNEFDAERIKATGLQTYRTRDGRRLFAVNWNQGRAYYWSVNP